MASSKENLPPNAKDPRGVLRSAAEKQVAALVPNAPARFCAEWERLEAGKVGLRQYPTDKAAEKQYRQRVAEVKRALKGNSALVEAVSAGRVTPEWLAEASGAELARPRPTQTPAKPKPATPDAAARAREAKAARRYELQYLRQLTARSPGDFAVDESEDEEPDFAALLAEPEPPAEPTPAPPPAMSPAPDGLPTPDLPKRRSKRVLFRTQSVKKRRPKPQSTPEVNKQAKDLTPPKFDTPPGLQHHAATAPVPHAASPRGSRRTPRKAVKYKDGRADKPKRVTKEIVKERRGGRQPRQPRQKNDAYDELGRRIRPAVPSPAAPSPAASPGLGDLWASPPDPRAAAPLSPAPRAPSPSPSPAKTPLADGVAALVKSAAASFFEQFVKPKAVKRPQSFYEAYIQPASGPKLQPQPKQQARGTMLQTPEARETRLARAPWRRASFGAST